jgi:hypothetical protein
MASEIRVCKCGKKVSTIRRSDFCSRSCKQQDHYAQKKEKLKGSRIVTFVLVHHCIRPELQMGETPDLVTCGCREEMPEEKLKECIRRGEIVLVGPEEHACYSSQHQKAPRAQTIEKAHVERANLSKDSRKYGGKSRKELQAAVDEDKASRTLEEQLRIEIFQEISIIERRKLIQEVPAELYDRRRDEFYGRQWLGLGGGD